MAESIYWIGRYVERAENVARFVNVNLTLLLDTPDPAGPQWEPLINITGDEELFKKGYDHPTQENVIKFLTFDEENPNSILSCLRYARRNARSIREIISSEMWLHLNKFYLMVNSAAGADLDLKQLQDFYSEVKLASHLFIGIKNSTMTHGEGWHFCRLGRKIELADKTSRIVDVKYFILLRSVQDVGTAWDDVQWAAVLRSASAFEMYRKDRGRITPRGVVDYLLFNRLFPRAIHFCLLSAHNSLHAISGTSVGMETNIPEQLLGQLCAELSHAEVDQIIASGLHEYLDQLQLKINEIGSGIHETFFAVKAARPGQNQVLSQGQTQ